METKEKKDKIDRRIIIQHLAMLERHEMKKLREATKDFKKRIISTRIALIRDIYDFIKAM